MGSLSLESFAAAEGMLAMLFSSILLSKLIFIIIFYIILNVDIFMFLLLTSINIDSYERFHVIASLNILYRT